MTMWKTEEVYSWLVRAYKTILFSNNTNKCKYVDNGIPYNVWNIIYNNIIYYFYMRWWNVRVRVKKTRTLARL